MVEAERVLSAARDGDILTLQTLRRSVPFAADSFGATALHHATRFGKLDCVKWMVERVGIKPKTKSKNGAAALHDAATQGKLLCVKFFIQECNMSPDLTDNSGHTALHLAARFGHYEIIRWLIEKANCNPKAKTRNLMSPIHCAASGGHLDCLELLVSKGSFSSINKLATDGTTPLYLAAQDGNFNCLKYLHTVGAKCDIKSRDGMHPIHAAAQNGHLDCIGYLVVQGQTSTVEEDTTGATPAHYAAGQGHLPVLKWLNVRSELNVKDNLGGTPLHDAAEKGQLHCIQFLVEVAELDVRLKDHSNMSPVDLAEKYGHRRCLDYMKISAAKIAQLKAQRMSNSSQSFDKRTAEQSTGSSFLHVLKKKGASRGCASPHSPESAKAPDIPALECTPEHSHPSTPEPKPPSLIKYAKSAEWTDTEITETSTVPTPEGAEVSHTYEMGTPVKRLHVIDRLKLPYLITVPSFPPRKGSTDATLHDVDAYSQNNDNARAFDMKPGDTSTEDMLNAAKKRTLFLSRSAGVRNGYSASPSPVVNFDENVGEREMEDFTSMVRAAREKLKSPSTPILVEFSEHEQEEKNDQKRLLSNNWFSPVSSKETASQPSQESDKQTSSSSISKDSERATQKSVTASPSHTKCQETLSPPTKSPENMYIPAPEKTASPDLQPAIPEAKEEPEQEQDPNSERLISPEAAPEQKHEGMPITTDQDPDHVSYPEQDKDIPAKSSFVSRSLSPQPGPSSRTEQEDPTKDEPLRAHVSLRERHQIPLTHFGGSSAEEVRPESLATKTTIAGETPICRVQLLLRFAVSLTRVRVRHFILYSKYIIRKESRDLQIQLSNTGDIKTRGYVNPQMMNFLTKKDKLSNGNCVIDEETWRTLPEWKRQIFRNRIMKEQEQEIENRKREEEEHQKYADVPHWRIPLLERKESDRLKEERKFVGMPEWKKNLLKKREYMYTSKQNDA